MGKKPATIHIRDIEVPTVVLGSNEFIQIHGNSDEEMSALRDTIERLIHVATGEVQHRYAGQCPDETNGYEGRDPDCLACQIILVWENFDVAGVVAQMLADYQPSA